MGLTGFYLPLPHRNSNGWKLIDILYMLPVHLLFILLSEEALSRLSAQLNVADENLPTFRW